MLTGVLLFLDIRSAMEEPTMFSGVAIYAALTALGPSFVASVVLPATSALPAGAGAHTANAGRPADGLRLTAYG